MNPAAARVLLTGATGGIGQAVAEALASAGAAVMLSGRSPARLQALRRGLPRRPGMETAIAWQAADLADPVAIEGLARAAIDWKANVLVNAAGAPAFGRLESTDPAEVARVMQTNLVAPILLTRALLPWFRTLPVAQVIQVGSVLGRLGLPGYGVYAASKFGLRGFTEALRRELADTRVKVQYLGPRSTRTDFNAAAVLDFNRATGTRMDDPDRVAAALLKLLESEAAERFLGFPEALAVRLNGLAPVMLDHGFRRHGRSLPADGAREAMPDAAPPGDPRPV